MIKELLLLTTMALSLSATTTTTVFQDVTDKTGSSCNNNICEDEYGQVYTDTQVNITTKNYKVDNFWKKFSFGGKGQESMNFNIISKNGTIRTTVEATSLCSLYPELDEDGCSGQKPFLINNEALINKSSGDMVSLQFNKDYDGASILYVNDNNLSFYPLDIDRDEKYYKRQDGDTACHSFFCAATNMFDNFFGINFFGNFFDFDVSSSAGADVDDVRQRYITNISAGLDQNHLMKKNITPLDTSINGLNSHDPVSLIDYVENTSATGSCNLGFFSFGTESTFCNFMSGMPFISFFASQTPTQTYVIDTIQVDTENAIIAFAGAYSDINVTEYETTVNTTLTDSATLFPPLEVMKNIMCMILPFMSCDNTTVEEEKGRIKDSYYTFAEENATTLTMAVTNNGTQIDGFQTFKLLGIHSIVGDGNVTTDGSCDKIQKTVRKCAMMGCVDTISIIDSNPTSAICDAYNPAIVTSESFMMFSETTTIESINYIAGSTTMNVSGRVLTLDLKLIDLNITDKASKLRYNLMETN